MIIINPQSVITETSVWNITYSSLGRVSQIGSFEVGTKYDLKTEVQEEITMLKPKGS